MEEAAWKKGIARTVKRFGSARTSLIVSVSPLASTPLMELAVPAAYAFAPTMLTAFGSLTRAAPGDLSSRFSARLIAYAKLCRANGRRRR